MAPLRRERLDAALRDHDAMALSLQWIRGRLHAVVVRPGRPARHVPLLTRSRALALRDRVEADLAATARTLAAPGASVLAPVVRASLAAGLAALDAEVLEPCARAAGDPAGLVIVPTGPLATVPWSMLASRAGRPTTVTRSLATWLDQDTRLAGDMGVAAVAGPDVPGGEREVTGVLDAWTPAPPTARGVTARRLDSTPAAVVDAVAAADLVHIAAHGRHRRDNPLFSSVWLTGGSLFAHEFEGRAHRASQVVLSSCGTGGSTVRPGDEPLGFASSLLAFGVAAVVAPVGDVPDDTARRTMLLYHHRLAAGTEASVALAGAVAEAATEGHWLAGAFTCFGAPWSRTVARPA